MPEKINKAIDKSHGNDISIIASNHDMLESERLEIFRIVAETHKQQYDSYLAAGFSEVQSLQLICAEIQKQK